MTARETTRPDSKGSADTPPVEPSHPAKPQQHETITHGERPDSSGHDIITERR